MKKKGSRRVRPRIYQKHVKLHILERQLSPQYIGSWQIWGASVNYSPSYVKMPACGSGLREICRVTADTFQDLFFHAQRLAFFIVPLPMEVVHG